MNRKRFKKKFHSWMIKHRDAIEYDGHSIGYYLRTDCNDKTSFIKEGDCYKKFWEAIKEI